MKKVFYSVVYNDWGFNNPQELWFDDLEEARVFSNQNYCDKMLVHTCTKPETTQKYEERVAFQNNPFEDIFLGMGCV